jgi:hypothetical protein
MNCWWSFSGGYNAGIMNTARVVEQDILFVRSLWIKQGRCRDIYKWK